MTGSHDDTKDGHHPRSRHRRRYDLPRLVAADPALEPFVRANPRGEPTVDFADPAAVRALNRAILVADYGVTAWDLPPDALCPPVPGRADHVHALADLLTDARGAVRTGDEVVVLDVGVGASCIYPIVGRREYGWRFVGTDVDPVALESARAIVDANPLLAGAVELRPSLSPDAVLRGVFREGESFAATICNPPFHESAAAAAAAHRDKLRGLGAAASRADAPRRNFGGRDAELWCEGGERGFLRRLIEQSAAFADRCGWFTSLVSRKESLRPAERALARVRPTEIRTLPLSHGRKTTRILAWRFGA